MTIQMVTVGYQSTPFSSSVELSFRRLSQMILNCFQRLQREAMIRLLLLQRSFQILVVSKTLIMAEFFHCRWSTRKESGTHGKGIRKWRHKKYNKSSHQEDHFPVIGVEISLSNDRDSLYFKVSNTWDRDTNKHTQTWKERWTTIQWLLKFKSIKPIKCANMVILVIISASLKQLLAITFNTHYHLRFEVSDI